MLHKFPVRGVTFEGRQAILEVLFSHWKRKRSSITARIGPVENEFDPHAVGVWFTGPESDDQVGFIPARDAPGVREAIEKGRVGKTKIIDFDKRRGVFYAKIGVEIRPDYDPELERILAMLDD